jgi:hypothetical protein
MLLKNTSSVLRLLSTSPPLKLVCAHMHTNMGRKEEMSEDAHQQQFTNDVGGEASRA